MNDLLRAQIKEAIPASRLGSGDDHRPAVVAKARELLDRARRAFPDWTPPPFDPAVYADALGIPVVFAGTPPGAEALLIPKPRQGFRIVCNPRIRTPGRVAFSLAHELAHTFFSDASRTLRMRAKPHAEDVTPAERELESLCDLGAAELLMPENHFQRSVTELGAGAAGVPRLAGRYAVSLEAACLRRLQCDAARVRAVGIFHYARRPSGRKASRSRRNGPQSGLQARQPMPVRGFEVPTYRVRRVFSAPGLPYLFPEGKSVPRESVIYRSSLGNREMHATETIALNGREERFEVSAFPLWDFSGPLKPPTVCAVFEAV